MERFVTTRALAACFVVLGTLDGVLTKMDWDPLHEVNPLMFALRESWTFWLVKIGATILCALALLLFATKYPQQLHKIFTFLVVCMMGVCVISIPALL